MTRGLGVALGAGELAVCLVSRENLNDRLVAAIAFEGETPDDAVDAAKALSRQLAEKAGRGEPPPSITSVGAGLPGHVDHLSGIVVYGQYLDPRSQPWRDEEFATTLADAFNAPAAIDNDVNCLVVYEYELGLGKQHSSFVVVYIAPDISGIGSGILIDGKLVRGCAGGAGEFGHFVVQPGGCRCHCGNRGCLEAVIGSPNIVRNVNWGDRNIVTNLPEAAHLADRGDARAIDTFRQAGRSFGQGLSALVNLLNPPLTIIGGPKEVINSASTKPSAVRAGRRQAARRPKSLSSAELFREGYEATLTEYSFAKLRGDCRFEIDHLTVETVAVGAAVMGLRNAEVNLGSTEGDGGAT